jgi:hypothetical protein
MSQPDAEPHPAVRVVLRSIVMRRMASWLILLAACVGCACLFRENYPSAQLTRLLREDSTSISGFYGYTWTAAGHIYYQVRCPTDTSRSGLWVMDAASRTSRRVSPVTGDRIEVSGDTLITAMDGNNTIVVMDSLGDIRCRRDVERWIFAIHLSEDHSRIYFSKLVAPMLLDLLRTALTDSAPIETLLTDVGSYLRFEGDTAVVYLDGVDFIRADLRTGFRSKSIDFGDDVQGMAWNPSIPDYLAVGRRGSWPHTGSGRVATIINLRNHNQRSWKVVPFDTCEAFVSGMSPDGTKLLITVTPYIPGDPNWTLDPELWIADLSQQ